jgi:hypothetical protein
LRFLALFFSPAGNGLPNSRYKRKSPIIRDGLQVVPSVHLLIPDLFFLIDEHIPTSDDVCPFPISGSMWNVAQLPLQANLEEYECIKGRVYESLPRW